MVLAPTDAQLKNALLTLRAEHPSLGVSKIHAMLQAGHPEWTISEKRTRRVMQCGGLMVGGGKRRVYPSSRVIEGLDVRKWTDKVEVVYFDAIKGAPMLHTFFKTLTLCIT
jgi:hypothetical protein